MDTDPKPADRWRNARAEKAPAAPAKPPSPGRAPASKIPDAAPGPGPAQGPGKARARKVPGWSGQLLVPPQVPMLDVEAALKEITLVPAATIHRAAAFAWASRAIAGYRVCAGKQAVQEGLSYLYLGEHYREAALAHAAMGEAWQPLFAEIDEAMAKDRQLAFASMRGRSPVATR